MGGLPSGDDITDSCAAGRFVHHAFEMAQWVASAEITRCRIFHGFTTMSAPPAMLQARSLSEIRFLKFAFLLSAVL